MCRNVFKVITIPRRGRNMEFLKSAVAAVNNVKGPPFPYTFGDQVTLDQSIWKLFNGVKRVGMVFINTRRSQLTCSL